MVNRDQRKTSDEHLADLTDRLLAGEVPGGATGSGSDPELEQAKETILMLDKALPIRQPDLEMQNRIRAKLAAEWNKSVPQVRKEAGEWRSARQSQRRLILQFSLAAVIFLVIVLASFPFSNMANPGAAGKASLWVPVIIVGTTLIILAIWQLSKNKRR